MPTLPPIPEALKKEKNPGWQELPQVETPNTYTQVFYREEYRDGILFGVWMAINSKGSISITSQNLHIPSDPQ